MPHRLILASALLAVLFLFVSDRSRALTLAPGDLVVVDNVTGVVVRVDPITGAQTLISSGGGGFDVTVAADGTIWQSGGPQGRFVKRVDPDTGAQTLSDPICSVCSATGIAIAADSSIIATSFGIGSGVHSVDPITGDASLLTDVFPDLKGVAVGAGGDLFIAPELGQQIVRLSSTGTLLQAYDLIGPPGESFGRPEDIAFAPDGDLIILDGIRDVFVKLDIDSGAQTILDPLVFSSFPFGMAVEADGSIVFTAFEDVPGSSAALWRFDPVTGTSSLVTSGGFLSGGNGLRSVAVVPVPEPGTAALLLVGLVAVVRARRR